MIDLHQRGHLTTMGKPAVLEYLEREDAARQRQQQEPLGGDAAGVIADGTLANGGWSNWTRRLTADSWLGGVRCRDVIYGYK